MHPCEIQKSHNERCCADEDQIELRIDESQFRTQQHGADRNPRPPFHDSELSLILSARGLTASSHRRNRRSSWCPSSCRAGIRSPPIHPSGAEACEESTSWKAPRDRLSALPCACPSG